MSRSKRLVLDWRVFMHVEMVMPMHDLKSAYTRLLGSHRLEAVSLRWPMRCCRCKKPHSIGNNAEMDPAAVLAIREGHIGLW